MSGKSIHQFEREVCDLLEVDPSKVTGIDISMDVGTMPRVTVRRFHFATHPSPSVVHTERHYRVKLIQKRWWHRFTLNETSQA